MLSKIQFFLITLIIDLALAYFGAKLRLGKIITLTIIGVFSALSYMYYHTKKESKASSNYEKEPFKITHVLSDQLNMELNDVMQGKKDDSPDSNSIFLIFPIIEFGNMAKELSDVYNSRDNFENKKERDLARKWKPVVEEVFPVFNSDYALKYVAIVYYLYLYRYIEKKNYNAPVREFVELSEKKFYRRYAEICPEDNENIVMLKGKIHQSLLSGYGGYEGIGLDLLKMLSEHVLLKYDPGIDLEGVFKYTHLYAYRWADAYMPYAYERLDMYQRELDTAFVHNEVCAPDDNDNVPESIEKKINDKFSTITFMDTIGVGDWLKTSANVRLLISCTEEFGKVIPGYSGEFHCTYLEYVKIVFHVEADGKTVVGFSMHFPCHDIWNLMVTDGKVITDKRVDRFSKCLHFNKMDAKDKFIPVRIVCADVLPCYSAGEEINMAVAAFPTEIHYYPDEEAWAHRHNKRLMNKVVNFTGNIYGWFDDLTVIKGRVKSIARCSCRNVNKEQKFFYCVTVETDFGDIGIYHERDFVREAEREFIREGAFVFASCVIQGDVAIGKYENGAIYDEEHCLKLLKDCFINGDFSRVSRALAEDVKYSYVDFRRASKSNKENIIKNLKALTDGIKKSKKVAYAYLGKIEGYHGNGTDNCVPAGKNILALAYEKPANFSYIVAIEINAENKIEEITIDYITDYSISIREDRHYEPDEYTYLRLIKEALDAGDLSRLINYFDYNIRYVEYTGDHYDGWYAAIGALGGLIDLKNIQHVDVNKFLVKVAEGVNRGKMGVGISFRGVEECKFVIFIEIIGDKIGVLQILPNEYILEELKPEDGGPTYNIARSAMQWLEFMKNWIKGEAVNKTKFYSAMDANCALTVDDGKMIKMVKGQKDVFAKLEEAVNSAYGQYCKIEKESLISTSFTLTLATGKDGKIKVFRIRRTGKETAAAPADKAKDVPSADAAENTVTADANKGTSQTQQPAITLDDLPKLKKMLDDGVITQKEFDAAKKKVLGDPDKP